MVDGVLGPHGENAVKDVEMELKKDLENAVVLQRKALVRFVLERHWKIQDVIKALVLVSIPPIHTQILIL